MVDAADRKKGDEKAAVNSASEQLLSDSQGRFFEKKDLNAAVGEIQRQEAYRGAVKSEADAEISWNQTIGSEKSVSSTDIKNRLKDQSLSPQQQGVLQFLDDNFSKIAGTVGNDSSRMSKADLMAVGGMNQISPEKIDAGVSFLKDHFFELSGLDDKVSSQRVDKLIYDHSFQLFSKETQERLYDIASVVKSSDQNPKSFDQGKRLHSGLTKDETDALNSKELSDNLRIQALEKTMFGAKFQRMDGKQLSPEQSSQYTAAEKRYRELQSKGLDKFLSQLDR